MESVVKNPLTSKFEKYKIILGSGSARRRELLETAGLNIDVVVKEHKEDILPDLHGHDIAVAISKQKSEAYRPITDDNVIVTTADTIVFCDGEVFGKPSDRDEAVEMIRRLSGKTHYVITGVTLASSKGEKSFYETTEVTFSAMSEDVIEYYVDSYQPLDKAGAYGIQEWIGLVACSQIKGSYMNVVGLPVERLLCELDDFVK